MQNPPPGQQSTQTAGQQSSLGIAPNVAAMICYLGALLVHIIVGLVLFFIEKENRFIRFHAMQSVLYVVACSVVMIVLAILNAIIGLAAAAADSGIISMLVGLITMVIWLVIPLIYLGGLILGAVKAYQNVKFKFPIIGNLAEKIAGSQ
jgi:uncharacterized membrane protein